MTYWDMDEYQVEDVMTEFLKKSLAQSEFDSTLGWFPFTLTKIYIIILIFMSVRPSSCSSVTLKSFSMLIATEYSISVQVQRTSLRSGDCKPYFYYHFPEKKSVKVKKSIILKTFYTKANFKTNFISQSNVILAFI